MALRNSLSIALKALRKNKLQTALTMIGMTIGVATVLTMIALGSGAQSAIQDQVRAAGMNLIVVQAGNWSRGAESGAGSGMSQYRPATDKPTFVAATWDMSRRARMIRVQGDSDASATGGGGNLPVHGTGRPGD